MSIPLSPAVLSPTPEVVVLSDALLWRVPARDRPVSSRTRGYSPMLVKAPAAEVFCGLNLVDWLAGATLVSVTARTRGVHRLGMARIEGTCVVVKIAGFDDTDGATNSCTFDFVSTTGSDFRTVFFTKS